MLTFLRSVMPLVIGLNVWRGCVAIEAGKSSGLFWAIAAVLLCQLIVLCRNEKEK